MGCFNSKEYKSHASGQPVMSERTCVNISLDREQSPEIMRTVLEAKQQNKFLSMAGPCCPEPRPRAGANRQLNDSYALGNIIGTGGEGTFMQNYIPVIIAWLIDTRMITRNIPIPPHTLPPMHSPIQDSLSSVLRPREKLGNNTLARSCHCQALTVVMTLKYVAGNKL